MTDKSRLRRELRARRAAVPARLRKAAGRRVERLALHARLIARGRRVGFYIPAKGEIDILPLLNRALWQGVGCYLPMVPPRLGDWHGRKRMWFSRLGEAAHHWSTNRYGIPEYTRQAGRVRAWQLQVLFVPMLGFDRQGYRMGMGGGYYDTTLAYLGRRRHWRKPLLVGVAFEAQGVEDLPHDPWDIPVDAVLTERALHRFTARA
ncbi:MAG: 5-formyltetrahydrofolate cyclo-ligase [Thiobacillaceae bacterium]|jgi:5-formyltetrahydrofolate cyclo-ligase|nr:5-formyltetrahydrofolate cyclo-ligase [Thiobacillaceae bacterium]